MKTITNNQITICQRRSPCDLNSLKVLFGIYYLVISIIVGHYHLLIIYILEFGYW